MNTYFKKAPKRLLFVLLFASIVTVYFSCQKAEPDPESVPGLGTLAHADTAGASHDTTINPPPPPDTTPSFKANVNSSGIISYTPSKNVVGSNTNLKGTSTYYSIDITFPTLSTGPGNYQIGFPSTTISATLINGSTTYYCNYNWGVGGSITIDSISTKGKYYGSFYFYAQDTVTFNVLNVLNGSFYHL